MSLEPKIKICIANDCKSINLYEQTGINNPNNPTGWGSPNINTDSITRPQRRQYLTEDSIIR